MRRRMFIGSLLLISLAWALPSRALAEQISCDRNICVYEHTNQTGCWFAVLGAGNLKDERFNNCPGQSVDDKVSSFSNPTSEDWIVLWEDPDGKGASFCIPPGARGNVPRSFNDKASSVTAFSRLRPDRGC